VAGYDSGRRPENENLPALLAMCKPLAVEGVTIILGFDYPLLREKFDKTPGAAATVTDVFRALTGIECGIRHGGNDRLSDSHQAGGIPGAGQ
jgi:hypothetical protein